MINKMKLALGNDPFSTGGHDPFNTGGHDPLGTSNGITNPIEANTLIDFINSLLDIIIQIGTPILVLMIIWVGFKFVTARGNSTKIEEAKQALLWTVVGAAIVLGAFVISTVIKTTVGSLTG